MPAGRAKGQFRIVVREFERIPSDQREKGTAILDITDVLHHPHVRQKEAVTFIPGARRLVFAETIEL